MAAYVKNFFTAKRRKTDSSSEDSDAQFQRPASSASSSNPRRRPPSGATSSSTSSFLSPSSSTTTNSMDYLVAEVGGSTPSTSAPSRSGDPTQRVTAGHRRQHSSLSAGHLQQYQQELASRHADNIARIAKRRRETERSYDPSEAPPEYKDRIAYYKSGNPLRNEEMRMLLIEAESRVLYDTSTIIKLNGDEMIDPRQKSPCGQFQCLKKKDDILKTSKMMFGAVPTMLRKDAFRLHVLEDQGKVLISKTFALPKNKKGAPPPKNRLNKLSPGDNQSTVRSLDGWKPRKTKSIMTTPEGFSRVRHVSCTFGEMTAEKTESSSQHQSPGSSASLPRAFSPPYRISKQRRNQMAVTTSLNETFPGSQPATSTSSMKTRSRMSSVCSAQGDEALKSQNMRNVSLGIFLPSRLMTFIMQHIPLIDAEMSRMENRVRNAATHPPTFIQNIYKSWEEMTEMLCMLHNSPRLRHPYWLALNESDQLESTLAEEFCEHLAFLVRRYDRKETGFFLSNLVTALLMHHLSWIASVATPPLGSLRNVRNPRQKVRELLLFGMQNQEGNHTGGYNALMAQYLEITGACGNLKSAKLVLLGDDLEVLASLCSVLSFFIRCSALRHVDKDTMWDVPEELPFTPIDVSGSPDAPGCSHHHRNLNSPPAPVRFVPPQETESGAMMRRLRKPPQSDDVSGSSSSNMPCSSAQAAARDDAKEQVAQDPAVSAQIKMDAMLAAQIEQEQEQEAPPTLPISIDPNAPSTSAQAAAAADREESLQTPPPQHGHSHAPSQGGGGIRINKAAFPCCRPIRGGAGNEMWSSHANPETLGRSMFAGPLDDYCPHFVLSAVLKNEANMPEVYSRMFDAVHCTEYPNNPRSSSTAIHLHSITSSSQSTSSIADLQSTPDEVLIVADLDQLSVKVLSSEGSDEVTSPSESVVGMLEQFVGIHHGVTPSAFLIGLIEDCLAQIVGKSLTLVELVRNDQNKDSSSSSSSSAPTQMSPERVSTIIGCDHSDLRLIVNVAAVYWPPVLQSVLG